MLNEIIKERIKKLKKLEKLGIDAYPEKTKRQFSISQALDNFSSWSKSKKKIVLAGRILSIREHGGAVFADIMDQDNKIQLLFKKNELGEEKLKFFQDFFDLGDFIETHGILFTTKKGEKTLLVKDFIILSKSLRPLPKTWYGLEDAEERFRRRYLDLIENENVKERFILRSKIIWAIRQFLDKKDFLEVETPILQPLYGGANANPFVSYLEALKMKIYLRIAPELYLKRLVVGGLENIYEIGKCFRNEGMDREHNPEFTILELYSAYKSREEAMSLVEELIKSLAKQFKKECPESKIFLTKTWPKIGYEDFLEKEIKLNFKNTKEQWLKKAKSMKIKINKNDSKEKIAESIFKKLRYKVITPTFIIDHPTAISPLAKKKQDDKEKTSRFQLIAAGSELINGFSELNDPQDQKERFLDQVKMRKKGDSEAHPLDIDYIEALEYGLPPTAGLGIGIDRLITVFTKAPSLKEVIFFPFMKPKK
ncbi:MAG: lysine--tRNA ligase [Candidatus Pacebacteria bacterium]|nr:lysine--tRNA ligase [Candidatus Paceibacterota bacterium]MDD5721803.1 lysine--tRNA ligase [Candidatus Paceibacterota bacterium]